MERYTKLAILGFVLPSFIVFYGNRSGAFATLFGFFYTISLQGLNITTYSNQSLGITLWTPLALFDPVNSLKATSATYGSPQVANLISTRVLLQSWGGFFFLASLIIFVLGMVLNYFISKATNEKFITEENQGLVINPYSRLIFFFTLAIVFMCQMATYNLVPNENSNFGQSFVIPVGLIFLYYAMISSLSDLEEYDLFVMKNLFYSLTIINVVVIILTLVIGNRFNLYAKMELFAVLFIIEVLLFLNIKTLNELKEQNKTITGSLLLQFISPVFNLFNIDISGHDKQLTRIFKNVTTKLILLVVAILFIYYALPLSLTLLLYFIISVLVIIVALLNLINLNRYNYEGKIRSLFRYTLIVSTLFIQEILYLLIIDNTIYHISITKIV